MTQLAEKREAKSVQIKDAAFRWDDPLDLDGELTEEERMVRDAARAYAHEKLLPRVLNALPNERFDPRDRDARWARLALLGATIPEPYGGAGLGYIAYGLIAREVERVNSGYRSAMRCSPPWSCTRSTPSARGAAPQISAEARQRRIHRLLRPDRARPRLRSRLDDDARRESRRRLPSERRQDVDHQLPDRRRRRGLGQARRRDPRLHRRARHQRLLHAEDRGQAVACAPRSPARSCSTTSSSPRRTCCPNVSGLAGPFGCLNLARYGIAWGAMGAAEFCWHRARDYVLERKQFGRPLAANQLVQKKLADMQTEITLGVHAALRARPHDRTGQGSPPAISLLKRNNCGKALDIARARPRHARRQRHLRRVPRDARASATWRRSTPTKARTTSTR